MNRSLKVTTEVFLPKKLEKLLFNEVLDFNKPISDLIHIFGEAGTGKTTLALQIACKFCAKGKKVVFIDTEGKVSAIRIKEIIQNTDFTKINKMLKLYTPSDFSKQHELIINMEYYLHNQKIDLLIIDTITNLYRQELKFNIKNKKNYERLAFQVALLKKIASEKSFLVVLFNQASMRKLKDENVLAPLKQERVSPVANAIMNYWTSREIILVAEGWGKYEARIPCEFEGSVKFGIDNSGIVPI